MIVSGSGNIEVDEGSARDVRHRIIFDGSPAFDTGLRRRRREKISFALGALATALVMNATIRSRVYHFFSSMRSVSCICVYWTQIVPWMRNCDGLLGSFL
jgi:hypothetical protein